LRVIPVIDLKGRVVVRGVAGRRAEYRPIASPLTASAEPADVASAFVNRFGLRCQYLADLDAIEGAEPAWDVYHRVRDLGVDLVIDAGIADMSRGRLLRGFDVGDSPDAGIVCGSESASEPGLVAALAAELGPRLVFSLDLREGKVLSPWGPWREAEAFDVACTVAEFGVRRMIVLDLARVGVAEGVGTEELCRKLKAARPEVELTSGGGIRGPEDLARLKAAGCSSALVSSALHGGRLTRAAIEAVGEA
jgi:phosphoribosylformimino-5-aminoimidazole carboxamide ribotide isomerase